MGGREGDVEIEERELKDPFKEGSDWREWMDECREHSRGRKGRE